MYILERLEGAVAVIEDGEKHLELPRTAISPDAREGDVLTHAGEQYLVDKLKTAERRAELAALRDRLRSRRDG